MAKRNIIRIDEEKCDGCGKCVLACAEGAIEIVDGKAKVVDEIFCDGLGACVGECPEGALTIEEREAPEFDEHRVKEHLALLTIEEVSPKACPGSIPMNLAPRGREESQKPSPQLSNWPVQLRLARPEASCFRNARLLLAADCCAFAYASMHSDFIKGRVTVIACPKLDDNRSQIDKLVEIFSSNDIREVKLVRMEVPCCGGLLTMARKALEGAGKSLPLEEVVISTDGAILKGSTG